MGLLLRGATMGVEMAFLIKSAFWLSLVLLIVPLGGAGEDEPQVGAIETFLAARAVVTDMANLCERRPQACEVGRSALHTIGVRAREGARIASEMFDGSFGEPAVTPARTAEAAAGTEPLHTGSIPVPSARIDPARE